MLQGLRRARAVVQVTPQQQLLVAQGQGPLVAGPGDAPRRPPRALPRAQGWPDPLRPGQALLEQGRRPGDVPLAQDDRAQAAEGVGFPPGAVRFPGQVEAGLQVPGGRPARRCCPAPRPASGGRRGAPQGADLPGQRSPSSIRARAGLSPLLATVRPRS